MNLAARLLVLLILLAAGWGVWFSAYSDGAKSESEDPQNPALGTPTDPSSQNGSGTPTGPTATQELADIPVFTSSEQCKACHEDVYAEWRSSHHAIAYTNPEVRKLSDDFRNKECQACHLPRPILETGLGRRPLPRYDRPNEGVGCITCHMDQHGRIVGRNTRLDAGCMPIRNEPWLTMENCKTCHNQHGTTDQWEASEYPSRKIDCNTCHMPEITRGHGGIGRGHVYPGAHDINMLRQAAEFRARKEGDKIIVEVENNGAGHNFPTEERHRAVDVIYRYVDEAQLELDAPAFTRLYRFRQPYVGDPRPNTQLPAHQTWTGEIPLTDAPKGKILQLQLVYKLQPFMTDADAKMLFEHRIPID
jgi:hypothetical protein